MTEQIQLRFAGSFGAGLEFVEAENADGESVSVGEWEQDGDHHLLKLNAEVNDD